MVGFLQIKYVISDLVYSPLNVFLSDFVCGMICRTVFIIYQILYIIIFCIEYVISIFHVPPCQACIITRLV